MEKEKDDLQQEEEEKEFLLEYIKMQNEAMKRIYKNTLDKEKMNKFISKNPPDLSYLNIIHKTFILITEYTNLNRLFAFIILLCC